MPEFRTHNSKRLVRKKKKKRFQGVFLQLYRRMNICLLQKKKTFVTLLLVPLPKMKIHESGDAAL